MNACPLCSRPWAKHTTRCEGGVPPVDLRDERGLAGKVISGYRILGGIGKGGMGTVYIALDNISEGQLDAVKILNRDLLVDRERLRREAVTANRVDHPNVCRIYNYVEAYDPESTTALTLIAMELVRGPTLREVQEERGGILELGRAALVVKEVADALTAIHSQEIVHRDIKPTNIIITRDPGQPERVKIVDFGIAKAVGGGGGQDLTEPGFVAATVHYASPELLRGKPEKRSDVYALGIVLYEILTGRRPFEATNQAELFSMILDTAVRPPSLEEARPGMGYPPALQKVVDRALERDPERRFSSPREFSGALMALVPQLAETVRVPVAGLPPEAPPPAPPSPKPPPSPPAPAPSKTRRQEKGARSWTSPAVIGGGIGGVAAVVTVLILAFRSFGIFGGGTPGAEDPVSIDPASSVLASGDTLDLSVSRGGEPLESGSSDIRWISRDPEVARVVGWGALVGGRVGSTVLMAVTNGDTARANVQVEPGPPARVTLVPSAMTLTPGRAEEISASVTDAQGNMILDPDIRWTSNASSVADVDATGSVRARAQGSATIRAEVGDAWNQVAVEVEAPQREPSPTPSDRPSTVCPDPVVESLDRLEGEMDNPEASRSALRDGALACWNRGDALTDEERAYAAWLIGLNTVNLEGCSQTAILWLDRAVQLEPGSEAYRVAREACRGGA